MEVKRERVATWLQEISALLMVFPLLDKMVANEEVNWELPLAMFLLASYTMCFSLSIDSPKQSQARCLCLGFVILAACIVFAACMQFSDPDSSKTARAIRILNFCAAHLIISSLMIRQFYNTTEK